MAQAYDFALDKIGMEIMSYQVRNLIQTFCNLCIFGIVWQNYNTFFPDLGGLHQLSQRSVRGSLFNFMLTFAELASCLDANIWLCFNSEAVGSYAENQRITAVRRVYQRGCVNPMINIEQLWRDYSKYEEVSTT